MMEHETTSHPADPPVGHVFDQMVIGEGLWLERRSPLLDSTQYQIQSRRFHLR